MDTLADDTDTMLALYVPAPLMNRLHWHDETRLDASATFINWLGDAGRMVTFAAYTGELEVDIVTAAETQERGRIGRLLCMGILPLSDIATGAASQDSEVMIDMRVKRQRKRSPP